MAVLVDQDTRLLCQGMTGWAGTYHTERMIQYGTKVVAGVTPGKGGQSHLGVPVFDSIAEAKKATGANASIVFVPPAKAGGAMLEAIAAEMPLVVVVTERIPVLDMVRVREALVGSRTRLVGPNSQGVLAPEVCQIGVMATDRARRGPIGVASRSASLTSEVVSQLTGAGLGQSTTIGIGGDPVHGIGFVECLDLFFKDPQTEGIVLVGEIGGTEEQDAARYIRETGLKKPVVALIVGRAAPHERRMGHAGALALMASDDADSKVKALQDAGVIIAPSAHLVGTTMAAAFARRAA
ncbi:MAG: succinate--CoA ligase subunit alpha [Alphaproteobacteria bacterium]|nr:succinate--CoA ligase subunit alpha [Alphaproteobacteria bacterium]